MSDTTITEKHYEELFDFFVQKLRETGQNVISAVLYGSVARGGYIPGRSDVLDAYVVLSSSVYDDPHVFAQVFEKMVEVTEEILAFPTLKKHAFHIYSQDQLDLFPAIFLPDIKKSGRLLYGSNIWQQIEPCEASKRVGRNAYFGFRQRMLGFAHSLLNPETLSPRERFQVFVTVVWDLTGFYLMAACNALDIWVDLDDAIGRLTEMLSDSEHIWILQDLKPAKREPRVYTQNQEKTCRFLRSAADLTEEIHQLIVQQHTEMK